jgi:hypothetical protein
VNNTVKFAPAIILPISLAGASSVWKRLSREAVPSKLARRNTLHEHRFQAPV